MAGKVFKIDFRGEKRDIIVVQFEDNGDLRWFFHELSFAGHEALNITVSEQIMIQKQLGQLIMDNLKPYITLDDH